MDFSLSHEQKMLVETVQQFISKELEPLEEEVERSGMLDPDLAEEIKNKSLEPVSYTHLTLPTNREV